MDEAEIKYWWDSIAMCESRHKKRVKQWDEYKKRLESKLTLSGVKDPVIINRFYKLLREQIASVVYRNPQMFIKAEANPSDPETGEALENADEILEDFANDALEAMRINPKARQVVFDAWFCFRGWLKFGFHKQTTAPYVASDAMLDDFTFVQHVRPENILVDPLVQPDDLYSARYIIEIMYPAIEEVIADPRFSEFETRLKGLRTTSTKTVNSSDAIFAPEDGAANDDDRDTLKKAHELMGSRKMYEVHDRVGQRRLVFIEGIREPIENIAHPFLEEEIATRPDPMDGKPLLTRLFPNIENEESGTAGTQVRKKFLVEGGLPYFSFAMDVADTFYGEPKAAYESPIQDALIRSITRQIEIVERYIPKVKVKKTATEEDPNLRAQIANPDIGALLELENLSDVEELVWGQRPSNDITIDRQLLDYEADTFRTTANAEREKLATGKALAASDAELNRTYDQQPVDEMHAWIIRNTFTVLSREQFAPREFLLTVTSPQGGQRVEMALKAWHLQGRFNVNVRVGSSNILYEQMQQEKALALVDRLLRSPNADQMKLDKYTISTFGEIDPEKLLRDDNNTDAAKAAALEIVETFKHGAAGHRPQVTPGEDHQTHIKLQSAVEIQKHELYASLPPEVQQLVVRVFDEHVRLHQQQQQAEMQGTGAPQGIEGPKDLLSEVQSDAQELSDAVTQQAEEIAA